MRNKCIFNETMQLCQMRVVCNVSKNGVESAFSTDLYSILQHFLMSHAHSGPPLCDIMNELIPYE